MNDGHNGRGHAWTREPELVARLRAGDAAALEELVRRHGGAMLATAQRFLPHAAEVREALKSACLAAFARARECPAEGELGRWLHDLVLEACIARVGSAGDPREALDGLLPAFGPAGSHARPVAAWNACARHPAELHAEVRARVDALPPALRVVVLLADGEGLDARAIAARLGLPHAEVRARLHRARQALITLLGPAVTPRAAG